MTINDSKPSNLLLVNANIITLDPLRPRAERVAIRDGLILAVGEGRNAEMPSPDHCQVWDCQEKTVLPGFHDAHCHLHAFAESIVGMDVSPANGFRSIADLKAAIREHALITKPGTWIRGRGYNEFYLAEKRHPSRWDLDEAAMDHPIKLSHRSGHAHVLNSRALELVGITMETPDPAGGLIDRHIQTGEPTGLLYEMGGFLSGRIPSVERREVERGVRLASEKLLSLGVTSIQDASFSNDAERREAFCFWKTERFFQPRITMLLGADAMKGVSVQDLYQMTRDDRVRLNGIKIILDETTGQLCPCQSELNRMVLEIHRTGLQVAIHAIEENAVSSACTAIEYALREFPKKDHRHRIEHCSVCHPALARKMAGLEILVVTNPAFIYYNGDRYLATVPDETLRHLYPIGTIIKEGAHLAAGSDFPIVPPDPLVGIHAAISRQSDTGSPVAVHEAIPVMDALRMHTCFPAEACFEETVKGTISPGKLADLVVLNGDPSRASYDEVKSMDVEITILGGRIVWEKPNLRKPLLPLSL